MGNAVGDGSRDGDRSSLRIERDEAQGRPLVRREHREEPLPLPSGHGDVDVREGEVQPGRRAIAPGVAIAGHVALLLASVLRFGAVEPPVPSTTAMSISYVVVPGDPPQGDPEGDDAPPPVEPAQEAPAAAAEEEATVGEAPASEEAPPSEKPSPDEAERPSVPTPAQGDGTMALGARTHGDAQGLDPGLMASVGQAVATRIRACWTPPASAPSGVAVRIVARYERDGTLSAAPSILVGEGASERVVTDPDPLQTEAAQAVERCSPMTLPAFLYPYWREVEIQIYSTRA